MKRLRTLLLATTLVPGMAWPHAIAFAQDAAFTLAQAQVPLPPGEAPPEEQKQKQQPREERRQERQEQRQQRQEQKQEQRQQQRQERSDQRQEQRQQRQELRQEQREERRPEAPPAPRPERTPSEVPPPPRIESPPSAPPPAERRVPPPQAEPPVPQIEKLPRTDERQQRREERREDRREERREDRRQDQRGEVPPIPPVPPRGEASPPVPTPPAAAPGATEAPSIAPAPPPAGEQPAIPPEELRGERRTPEQRQRAERRVEQEFQNRDRRFDERFNRRIEERDGRTVIREGDDRIIIREGDRTIIRSDETERLRRDARDVREERRGNEIVTVIRRPNGVEIITVKDADGNLIRRIRRVNGRESVLIDNERAWERSGRWERGRGWRDRDRDRGGLFFDFYVDVPPVVIDIPREDYIIDADRGSYEEFEEALEAPPLVESERPYSLQEVTQNVRLRERVRSIDLNTITFASGDWRVADDQVPQLEDIARAMKAVIDRNPDEVYLIEGHTDAVGSALDNLSLSDRRAEEVAAILTQYYQIPAENLVTQGYGEDYLKVNTLAANSENRRVTIRNITGLLNAQRDQNAPQ